MEDRKMSLLSGSHNEQDKERNLNISETKNEGNLIKKIKSDDVSQSISEKKITKSNDVNQKEEEVSLINNNDLTKKGNGKLKNSSITNAERCRIYRQRKKALQQKSENKQSKIYLSNAEKCRRYRQRKKMNQIKLLTTISNNTEGNDVLIVENALSKNALHCRRYREKKARLRALALLTTESSLVKGDVNHFFVEGECSKAGYSTTTSRNGAAVLENGLSNRKQSVPLPKKTCKTDEDIEIEETHLEVPPCDIKEEHTSPDTIEPPCPAVTNLKRLHPSTIEPSCPTVTNLKSLHSSVTQEDSPGEKPFDIFGKYVAAELHQLSERQAILVQQEIQNCITKARLACLDYKSNSPVEVMYIDVRPSISSNLIESTCKDSNDAVFND